MAESFGLAPEFVCCLAHYIVDFVGRARPVLIVVALEQVSRQVTRSEWPTGFVERGARSLDCLRNQTFLNS